ncbi:MAG: glycosyltransferase family 2 protein [Acholeplasmatales bacterium]|nr:glycosyltransferase family 2 protein [Acholeplasmatales bacterium]
MYNVDIVCPVYKGYHYLEPLYESFKIQKEININKIVFAITDSKDEEMDKIREFVKEKNITSFEVSKEEFSHSLTRQKAIMEYCSSNIVIMISQDIKLTNDEVFKNLVKDIDSGKTVYNYARQICTNKSIEKYIRKKNYPTESYIVSNEDVERMQLMAFFASDACSAYNRDVFIKLGGYGDFNLMMNEDQMYSKIILDNGYKKKYCADAVVEHSHKYKLKQLYKRYYEAGKFYAEVKVFDNYKSTDSGMKLAFYVLGQALKHFDLPVLFRWLPDMTSRYLGMKKGRKAGKKNNG